MSKPSKEVRDALTKGSYDKFEGLAEALTLARSEDDFAYLTDYIVRSMGGAWEAREYLMKVFRRAPLPEIREKKIGESIKLPENLLKMKAVDFFSHERGARSGINKRIVSFLQASVQCAHGWPYLQEELTIEHILAGTERDLYRLPRAGSLSVRAALKMLLAASKSKN